MQLAEAVQEAPARFAPGPRSALAERIVAHMVERIAPAKVTDEPYQHFWVGQIFPDDVYAEIRRRLPARDRYLPLNIKRWRNAAGQSTRDRLVLSEDEISRITPEDQPFWVDITTALMARELQQAFYAKMTRDISVRLGYAPHDVLKQPAWHSILLVRDFEDYKLKPHPDGQPRVVTTMFYLPADDSREDLGTSIYRRKPLVNRLFGDKFEETGRFPYLANSVGVFAVNDAPERISWHGREVIEGDAVVRDSIILAYLSKDAPEFGKKHNANY
ncbi:MAG: hypothetical protein FJX29_10040 [Alphaproteobacteria bacterium]|nr:hypothetical protein [Alphaproteobacteria bacterium]